MTARLLQSLPSMSLAVSIVVIICMAISFAVLFLMYGKTKSRGINFGVEDASLKKQLSGKLAKTDSNLTYCQLLEAEKRREKIVQIITDVILFIIAGFVGALTVFSIVLRTKGEQIYFGDTAYLTVLTSSMQEKNEDNQYLKENDDGVRIDQYALIGIDKRDPSLLKVGDIIAFKFEGDMIYVHRIVSIKQNGDELTFTTMGDANSSSLFNETDIAADRIVGVYNGYHNVGLGVLLIYMRSDIGIVALIFVFLLLAVIDAAELIVTRSYEKRQFSLAKQMDGEQYDAPQNNYEDIPQSDFEYGDLQSYTSGEQSYDYSGNYRDMISDGFDGGGEDKLPSPTENDDIQIPDGDALTADENDFIQPSYDDIATPDVETAEEEDIEMTADDESGTYTPDEAEVIQPAEIEAYDLSEETDVTPNETDYASTAEGDSDEEEIESFYDWLNEPADKEEIETYFDEPHGKDGEDD